MHLLSTSRYLICLKYSSNFACNLAENCRLQLCAFLTSHSQKKNVFVYVFATNFELLQLKKFFFLTCKSTRTRTFLRYSYSSTFFNISTRTRSFLRYSYSEIEYSTPSLVPPPRETPKWTPQKSIFELLNLGCLFVLLTAEI